ncbi:hypothetical protein N657DRAFT_647570 [Parathielavia appendiculata]|uniref:Uncharacterized protein n=1 Tax=Parathielavia appendiculata TaxID=2587402 RepID=A0AAN6Z236_9PEZI|nr:hypothetical protein N657DRAFT_647570 [Parathielavia appendiculata]
MTPILSLLDEVLTAVAANTLSLSDPAASAQTKTLDVLHRRPRALYAAAAPDSTAVRRWLFYSAENGFLESIFATYWPHGVNQNPIYVSPGPGDRLHPALAAQERRPGRQPLIDRKLGLETIEVTLRETESNKN